MRRNNNQNSYLAFSVKQHIVKDTNCTINIFTIYQYHINYQFDINLTIYFCIFNIQLVVYTYIFYSKQTYMYRHLNSHMIFIYQSIAIMTNNQVVERKEKKEMKDKHISLGAALYTINKYAKSIRDARQILKHILFDQRYTEPPETPDALMDFFQNTSLCYEDLYVYNIDGMPDKLHEIENELFYRIEADLIEIGEEHEEIQEWMINNKFTKYDLISLCIGDFQLSEDIPNILLDYAEYIEYDVMFIRDLNTNIQLAHKYLHDSLIIKDFLYDLKEAVILTLNIPVIGYHEFRNDKNNPKYRHGIRVQF